MTLQVKGAFQHQRLRSGSPTLQEDKMNQQQNRDPQETFSSFAIFQLTYFPLFRVMNYAASEVNCLIKVVIAEQTSTIFMFQHFIPMSTRKRQIALKGRWQNVAKLIINNCALIKQNVWSLALWGSTFEPTTVIITHSSLQDKMSAIWLCNRQ